MSIFVSNVRAAASTVACALVNRVWSGHIFGPANAIATAATDAVLARTGTSVRTALGYVSSSTGPSAAFSSLRTHLVRNVESAPQATVRGTTPPPVAPKPASASIANQLVADSQNGTRIPIRIRLHASHSAAQAVTNAVAHAAAPKPKRHVDFSPAISIAESNRRGLTNFSERAGVLGIETADGQIQPTALCVRNSFVSYRAAVLAEESRQRAIQRTALQAVPTARSHASQVSSSAQNRATCGALAALLSTSRC